MFFRFFNGNSLKRCRDVIFPCRKTHWMNFVLSLIYNDFLFCLIVFPQTFLRSAEIKKTCYSNSTSLFTQGNFLDFCQIF